MAVYEFTVKEEEVLQFKKRRYVRMLTERAIKKGDLVRPKTCELCQGNENGIEAHHVDYGKPYDVIWLCSICHGKAHRKDHALNPANNKQSPLPSSVDQYQNVTVTFTIPARNFLALKKKAEDQGVTIAQLVREKTLQGYPLEEPQLQFKFEEKKDDKPHEGKEQGIQSMDKDERLLPEPKLTLLPKIRQKRNLNMQGMDGQLFPIFAGHGGDARRMQRFRIN